MKLSRRKVSRGQASLALAVIKGPGQSITKILQIARGPIRCCPSEMYFERPATAIVRYSLDVKRYNGLFLLSLSEVLDDTVSSELQMCWVVRELNR